jgi:hypothetical protein
MKLLQEKVDRAKSLRSQIQALDTRSDTDTENKLTQLQRADHELEDLRLVGDIAIAAFFDSVGKSKKDSQELQESYKSTVRAWRQGKYNPDAENSPRLLSISGTLRNQGKGIMPFNWEVEFPEVFDRQNSGFDAIIGNPPFAGKNTTISGHAEGYLDWLKEVYPESHGNSDLVAYFFRRAFTLLRKDGCLGLIATNTIAQGDTRSTGLRFVCKDGGTIYNAQKRVKWAGDAAVVVSVLNIKKGTYAGVKLLNGKEVPLISAFLFHAGGHEDPKPLAANAGKSFNGCDIKGIGFTFDDSNPDATSIEEMHRLIEKDPRNAERIFPYIGGEEVNSNPTHSHHRYVINFGEMTEEEARQYPDLMEIVERKVKPDRLYNLKGVSQYPWWKFWRNRRELYNTIDTLERVLVIPCSATKYLGFVFLSSKIVFSHKLTVFALNRFSDFALIQSSPHENWARFFSATLGDGLTYNPSDCFETFPFPLIPDPSPTTEAGSQKIDISPASILEEENSQKTNISPSSKLGEKPGVRETLETIGKEYYEYRAQLMLRNNQGLTDTYNRFHNPEENHPDILKLRQLHTQMDLAVLKAYGWEDLDTTCGFALDYLDLDEDNDIPPEAQDRIASGDYFFPTAEEAMHFESLISTGKRKLPWRYRWCETTHDEVLARLLDLNQSRYEEEILGGKTKANNSRFRGEPKSRRKSSANTPTIPGIL